MRIAPHRAATDGAFAVNVFEEIERLGAAGPLRFHHLDHRWDHFTGFLDHNCVADANVFAFDFIFIVQGRTRNPAAAHRYRLERRYWRKHAGAPDLN